MSNPTVAIVGASRNRAKYGNISVHAHRERGYDVYPVNPGTDEIAGLRCYPSLAAIPVAKLDRVSVYLPPEKSLVLLDELQRLPTCEVWFNPGSADRRVRERASELGIEIIEACSIVNVGGFA